MSVYPREWEAIVLYQMAEAKELVQLIELREYKLSDLPCPMQVLTAETLAREIHVLSDEPAWWNRVFDHVVSVEHGLRKLAQGTVYCP